MINNVTETLLVEIGQLLRLDAEYADENTLLYAQVDHNMTGEAIFKELGNQILYRRRTPRRLLYALLELWNDQPDADRWSEMEYVVRDGRFEVTYTYPDEIDPQEDELDRRDRIVRKHFGVKPIVYPPWPPTDEDGEDLPSYEL